MKFALKAPFKPAGDQLKAIKQLVEGIGKNYQRQTLLGTTGSGKTFSLAHVIEKTQRPVLVISHNKTLAAQLADEFKDFFPENAVEYFVSYYDYYQPEAYIPRTDTYIAKDSSINDEIDRLRHAAMESVLTRKDVVVVASVSCIYGVGSPADYLEFRISLQPGLKMNRQELLRRLTFLQYTRNDIDLVRGAYRVRGDTVDIHPAGEDKIIRVEFFGPNIDKVTRLDDLTGAPLQSTHYSLQPISIFPATFFITSRNRHQAALAAIREELKERIAYFKKANKLVEAQRIEQRATYDLEMIEQLGYVSGVENYSRHFDGRAVGAPPSTLIDYFNHSYNKNWLLFIDESHMTIPQIGAMSGGDAARKQSLVDFGWRLPSARDNRPLKFHEFEDRVSQTIFVSATPSEYEKNTSQKIVEQIVRPTGLLDPTIDMKPTEHQVDDIINEISIRIAKKQRILVTTLTKRMAEELSTYLIEMGLKAAYLHSDIATFERLEILRNLRTGTYDVLVGINLLREGLDLPEVSLVAIMDADKEGYLRSETALVQVMGRAARHLEGHVIMYADKITGSMQRAIDETNRRRNLQEDFNKKHRITPRSIQKKIRDSRLAGKPLEEHLDLSIEDIPPDERARALKELENKMHLAAQNLEFEKAAKYRDIIQELRKRK